MIGAGISLVWCLVALAACTRVQTPNASLYPEIDFASKCIGPNTGYGLDQFLYPLSNAMSKEIRQYISTQRIFVSVVSGSRSDGHIALSLEEKLGLLKKGRKYS
jgi:hypothetical protein